MDFEKELKHLVKSHIVQDDTLSILQFQLESLEETLKKLNPEAYSAYRHSLFLKLKEHFPNTDAPTVDHD